MPLCERRRFSRDASNDGVLSLHSDCHAGESLESVRAVESDAKTLETASVSSFDEEQKDVLSCRRYLDALRHVALSENEGYYTTCDPGACIHNKALPVIRVVYGILICFGAFIWFFFFFTIHRSPLPKQSISALHQKITQNLLSGPSNITAVVLPLCSSSLSRFDFSSFDQEICSSMTTGGGGISFLPWDSTAAPSVERLLSALPTSAGPTKQVSNGMDYVGRYCNGEHALLDNGQIFSLLNLLETAWAAQHNTPAPYIVVMDIVGPLPMPQAVYVSENASALLRISPGAVNRRMSFPFFFCSSDLQEVLKALWIPSTATVRDTAAQKPLFFSKPKHQFHFFLVSDSLQRLGWEFERMIQENTPLASFLERLRLLIDIDVFSQILGRTQWMPFLKKRGFNGKESSVASQFFLAKLREQLELIPTVIAPHSSYYSDAVWSLGLWLPDPVTVRNYPITSLFAEKSSKNASTVVERHSAQSVALAQSGAVVFADPPTDAEQHKSHRSNNNVLCPSVSQMNTALSHWIAQTRAALGLPSEHLLARLCDTYSLEYASRDSRNFFCSVTSRPFSRVASETVGVDEVTELQGYHYAVCNRTEATVVSKSFETPAPAVFSVVAQVPVKTGITQWEVNELQRQAFYAFSTAGIETLVAVLKIFDHLTYIPISDAFRESVELAVSHLARATASTDSFSERIRSAREAYHIAQKCIHEAETLGDVPLAPSYLAAVYLPLLLPLVATLILIVMRELKHYRRCRQHHKVTATSSQKEKQL